MLDKKTVALINEKLERIAFIDKEKAQLQLEAQNLLGLAMGTHTPVEFTEAEIFPTRKSKVKKPKAAKKKKKEKGWSPASTPAKEHPWRATGKKKKADSESVEAIKADIIADKLKTDEIADKHGVSKSTVYNLRWTMKKDGEISGGKPRKARAKAAPAPAEEPADPEPRADSPALKRDPMTAEEFKVVKRMLHEEKKLGSEIVRATGVDMEEIEIAGNSNAYGMYIFNRKRK